MTSPRDALKAVARAVANSGELPNEMSVLLQEADESADDADVDLPLLEIQLSSADEVNLHNSDFLGFTTDEDGNHTGRVYTSEYELEIEMSIWTVKDDGYSPDELGERLRKALYPYSAYGPAQDFPDSEGNALDDINFFRLLDGERSDDILQTPTVRQWTQTAALLGCEQFRTDEDYILSVDSPKSGEFSDVDGDGLIDNLSTDKDV